MTYRIMLLVELTKPEEVGEALTGKEVQAFEAV